MCVFLVVVVGSGLIVTFGIVSSIWPFFLIQSWDWGFVCDCRYKCFLLCCGVCVVVKTFGVFRWWLLVVWFPEDVVCLMRVFVEFFVRLVLGFLI